LAPDFATNFMKLNLFNLKSAIYTVLVAGSLTLTSTEGYAQDPEFTQFYANPLYLNPAFAGTARCPRVAMNYRNQWPALSGTYVTTSVSYDQHVESLYGGLGLMVTSDKAGEATLNTTTINALYSYQLKISRSFSLRFGVMASYFQKSLDWNKLTFGDMIDPRRGFVYQTGDVPRGGTVGNIDFSAGVLGFSESFFVGFAVHHLTEPNESLITGNSPLPMKITGHAGAVIPLSNSKYSSNDAKISPNLMYRSQGTFQQLNMGMYLSKGPLVGGVWYRNKDAFIALIGISTPNVKMGYSYDVTVSKLTNASGGSHEISFTINFNCKPKKRTFRTISCPSF
jgi:type IX secretion system PorP/SprF family membrane protein